MRRRFSVTAQLLYARPQLKMFPQCENPVKIDGLGTQSLRRAFSNCNPLRVTCLAAFPETLHPLQLQRVAQLDDLVAEGGGALELKLLGGFVHLLFEVGDPFDQFIRREG